MYAIELTGCVSDTAVITETNPINACEGILTAGIEVDSGFVVDSYAWSYTVSGGSPVDSESSTEYTFDIS